MSTPTTRVQGLADRVQALPPELYNDIYELTFTAPCNEVFVNKPYRPPALLQINQHSRELYARTYYCNTTFSVNESQSERWSKSLPFHHSMLLSNVKVCGWVTSASGETRARLQRLLEEELVELDWAHQHPHAHKVFKFCVSFEHSAGPKTWRWMSCSEKNFIEDASDLHRSAYSWYLDG